MKTALLAAGLLTFNLAQAAEPPPPVAPAKASSTARWADRCTDFTTNGSAFKAPRVFLQWLDVVTDPAIWLEMGNRGLEPQSYVRTLSSLIDPGMPKNFLEWTNPEILDKWAHAATEPDFYTAVNATLFDPGRMMRWAMLPLDARTWKLVGKAVNPQTWMNWATAPADPKTQALVTKAFDPENAAKWLQAWVEPGNYALLKTSVKKMVY
jgi:hypothetical protein